MAETALLGGALVTSALSLGLFLTGAAAWSTSYVNLLNAGWSFFGYSVEGVGGALGGEGHVYLGLQGLGIYTDSTGAAGVFGALPANAGTTLYYPWSYFINYPGGAPGNFPTSCQVAGETAFALVLTAIAFTFMLLIVTINRLGFSNTGLNKGYAIAAAFFAFLVSVTAFSNWQVNCYLAFKDNFQNFLREPNLDGTFGLPYDEVAIGQTNYEYYGFNVVVVAWVFSLVSLVLHAAAPTAGAGGAAPSAPEKAVEAA